MIGFHKRFRTRFLRYHLALMAFSSFSQLAMITRRLLYLAKKGFFRFFHQEQKLLTADFLETLSRARVSCFGLPL